VGHDSVSATATRSRLQLARAFLRDIRSPEWGLAGQLIRFAVSGSVVAVVYVSVTTVLHDAFAVPFQAALAIGFVTGLGLHFTLQRMFVWRRREQFALAVHHQAVRYLCVCASQYGVTALATAQLPSLVGLPVEAIYLLTMFTIAVFNFLIFRGGVFHSDLEPKHDAMPQ
jgi:putative flippase GtrA